MEHLALFSLLWDFSEFVVVVHYMVTEAQTHPLWLIAFQEK